MTVSEDHSIPLNAVTVTVVVAHVLLTTVEGLAGSLTLTTRLGIHVDIERKILEKHAVMDKSTLDFPTPPRHPLGD